jgi:hypothetical protein
MQTRNMLAKMTYYRVKSGIIHGPCVVVRCPCRESQMQDKPEGKEEKTVLASSCLDTGWPPTWPGEIDAVGTKS